MPKNKNNKVKKTQEINLDKEQEVEFNVKPIDMPKSQSYEVKNTSITAEGQAYKRQFNQKNFFGMVEDNISSGGGSGLTNPLTENLDLGVNDIVNVKDIVVNDTGSYKIGANKVLRRSAVNSDTIDSGNHAYDFVILSKDTLGKVYVDDPTNNDKTIVINSDLTPITNNVATNTSGIATNVANIATNVANIATNVQGIGANAIEIVSLQEYAFTRTKYEKSVASGANLDITTSLQELGALIGITAGETPFYDQPNALFNPKNQNTMCRFKFSFNGTFDGGGGQGIELVVTIGTTTQTYSITRADVNQNGFTILGWIEIDKDGGAVTNGMNFSVISVDDIFSIDSYTFSIAQDDLVTFTKKKDSKK